MLKIRNNLIIISFVILTLIVDLLLYQKINDLKDKITVIFAFSSLMISLLNFILVSSKISLISANFSSSNKFSIGVSNKIKIPFYNYGNEIGTISIVSIHYSKSNTKKDLIRYLIFKKYPTDAESLDEFDKDFFSINPKHQVTIEVRINKSLESGRLYITTENINKKKRCFRIPLEIKK